MPGGSGSGNGSRPNKRKGANANASATTAKSPFLKYRQLQQDRKKQYREQQQEAARAEATNEVQMAPIRSDVVDEATMAKRRKARFGKVPKSFVVERYNIHKQPDIVSFDIAEKFLAAIRLDPVTGEAKGGVLYDLLEFKELAWFGLYKRQAKLDLRQAPVFSKSTSRAKDDKGKRVMTEVESIDRLMQWLKGTRVSEVDRIVHKVGAEPFFRGCFVVVENQMDRRNAVLQTVVYTHFWGSSIKVMPQSVKRHFEVSGLGYYYGKKKAVELARVAMPKFIQQVEISGNKADDVSDAYLQGLYAQQKLKEVGKIVVAAPISINNNNNNNSGAS